MAARHAPRGFPFKGHPPDIQTTFGVDVTLVRLSGDIDMSARERLQEVAGLVIDFGSPVRVDVSEVTFLDSSGIAFLAQLAGAGYASGSVPMVTGAQGAVRQAIEISGLQPMIDLRDRPG